MTPARVVARHADTSPGRGRVVTHVRTTSSRSPQGRRRLLLTAAMSVALGSTALGSTALGSTALGSTALGSTALGVGPATATVAPTALSQTMTPPTPGAPAPQAARDVPDGPQRWAPPLAGAPAGVAIAQGTVRLSPDRGRTGPSRPASLRGAQREGLLDLGEHRFGSPVNRFDVPVDADVPVGTAVEVDVRGLGPDGHWSEWEPARPGAPAVLDEPTRVVAARVVLIGSRAASGAGPQARPGAEITPVVRSLQVLADRVVTGPRVVAPRAVYRVFATREGLVGGLTANGHKIIPNDQFAALPSRRALSPLGRGDYSVRICSDAHRCATVPVWDVGPWNITDDYWNPSALRQTWRDLTQGVPQAAAAFSTHHNGGRDGFGRTVSNPAGIDLSDGTFRTLGLPTNGLVTVEYLWTGQDAAAGQVVSPGVPVVVRNGPSLTGSDVGVLGDGARVGIECQAPGSPVAGALGTSTYWLRLASGQWAPSSVVAGVPPVPACG